MSTLNVKVSGVWTPIAGDVNASNPINDFISQNTPTPWVPLTLVNGWTNVAGFWSVTAYRKIGDIVYIRGLVTNAAGSVATNIVTLPASIIPISGVSIVTSQSLAWSDAAAVPVVGRVDVRSDVGSIQHVAPIRTGVSVSHLSLNLYYSTVL